MTLSPRARKWISSLVDFGWPLGLIVGYAITRDMVSASWGLVAGAAIALVVGYVFERRIAPMPLVAGLLAVVFGVLTLVFDDPRFVKIKPSVTSAAFGLFLVGGMLMNKNPLKLLLNAAFQLPDEAWRKLTWRYGAFFLLMAAANEVVWRTQSDAVWLAFRFPTITIVHVLFGFAQVPLMMRYLKTDEPPPPVVE